MRHHQSGTSVNKPGRISKHGNKYLRRALHAGTRPAPTIRTPLRSSSGCRREARRACRSTRRSCARCSPPPGR
ncbi:MAG: transposase [Gammaproteobacteria bacterium]|nr:transposase [Gammaproteobacteria bacterium]